MDVVNESNKPESNNNITKKNIVRPNTQNMVRSNLQSENKSNTNNTVGQNKKPIVRPQQNNSNNTVKNVQTNRTVVNTNKNSNNEGRNLQQPVTTSNRQINNTVVRQQQNISRQTTQANGLNQINRPAQNNNVNRERINNQTQQSNQRQLNNQNATQQSVQNKRVSQMTRLEKQDNNISDNRYYQQLPQQDITKQENKDRFVFSNTNKASFEVKEVKKSSTHFLLLPVIIIVILAIIIIYIIRGVFSNVKELKLNTSSLLSSKAATEEDFKNLANENGLNIEEKEFQDGIKEITCIADEMAFELNYIKFSSSQEAEAYYNYIISESDEEKSSASHSISGKNSAETTLISKTYNGFMDITYIDNTIIIGIAYDSNEHSTIINLMNKLGY